jgi:uncharacterized sulfatase
MKTLLRLVLAGATAACVVAAQPAAPAARSPNVLFIMSDDMNNNLGAYGHPLVKTPNLDRLAQRGVRFDRAYCQFPLCNPSRASMLTGLRPDQIKIYDLDTHFRFKAPEVVTLPQLFRRHGYEAVRIGKIYHYGVPEEIGSPGFDDPASWDKTLNPFGRDATNKDKLINFTPHIPIGGALAYRIDEGPDEEQTDGWVATLAIRELERLQAADKPFFLGVGFYRPHLPFVAPKKYFDLYPLESIPAPVDPTESLKNVPAPAFGTPLFAGLTPKQQRLMIRGYYASISFVDAQVGRVLDSLDRLGLTRDTIVVFVSDHGFLLGEHGQWWKQRLFEESIRAPLIITAPDNTPGAAPLPVEFVDIYPTVAELAHLPAPAGLAGRSLVPLLMQPDTPWPHAAFSQNAAGTAIRTDCWAYHEWGPAGIDGVELYDHRADPAEQHNLARDPACAAIVAELSARLRDRLPPRPVIEKAPRRPWWPKQSPGYIPDEDR